MNDSILFTDWGRLRPLSSSLLAGLDGEHKQCRARHPASSGRRRVTEVTPITQVPRSFHAQPAIDTCEVPPPRGRVELAATGVEYRGTGTGQDQCHALFEDSERGLGSFRRQGRLLEVHERHDGAVSGELQPDVIPNPNGEFVAAPVVVG